MGHPILLKYPATFAQHFIDKSLTGIGENEKQLKRNCDAELSHICKLNCQTAKMMQKTYLIQTGQSAMSTVFT